MLIYLPQVTDQLKAFISCRGLHEGQLVRDVGQALDKARGGEEALQFGAAQWVRNFGQGACVHRIFLKRESERLQHDIFGINLD